MGQNCTQNCCTDLEEDPHFNIYEIKNKQNAFSPIKNIDNLQYKKRCNPTPPFQTYNFNF